MKKTQTRNSFWDDEGQRFALFCLELSRFFAVFNEIKQTAEPVAIHHFLQSAPCHSQANGSCAGFILQPIKGEISLPEFMDCPCQFLQKRFSSVLDSPLLPTVAAHWSEQTLLSNRKKRPIAWQTQQKHEENLAEALDLLARMAFLLFDTSPLQQERDNGLPADFNGFYRMFLFAEALLCHPKIQLISWKNVKKKITMPQAWPQQGLVVLCFENTCFDLKASSASELLTFSQFIKDQNTRDNALVVFAKQRLMREKQEKAFSLKKSYSVDLRKIQEEKELSIEDLLNPGGHSKSNREEPEKPQELFGIFDRLIEALALGQQNIEKAYRFF